MNRENGQAKFARRKEPLREKENRERHQRPLLNHHNLIYLKWLLKSNQIGLRQYKDSMTIYNNISIHLGKQDDFISKNIVSNGMIVFPQLLGISSLW